MDRGIRPSALGSAPTTRPRIADFRHLPSTLNALLAAAARAYPDAPALIAPNREDLTHAALIARLDGIAHELAAFGLGHGSRIAVALPEGPDCVVAVLAVCCCGTCVPINPELDAETLFRQLVAMRVDALIAPEDADTSARRAACRAQIPVIDLCPASGITAGSFRLSAHTGLSALRVEFPELDDAALLMTTSGTTGASTNSVVAPRDTPLEVLGTLRRALHQALREPEVKEGLRRMGFEAFDEEPEEFASALKSAIERFRLLIKQTGIRIEIQ